MFDGRPVTSSDQWYKERKPELQRLFEHYMYGEIPSAPSLAGDAFTVTRQDVGFMDGKATLKEVSIRLGSAGVPELHLLLIVPNDRAGQVPVFLGLNFLGNHTVVADPKVALPTVWVPRNPPGSVNNRATDASRGAQVDVWAVDDVIQRGYALATIYCGDIAPDHPGRDDGVFPFFLKPGESRPGPNDWGAIAAWAWGLSRGVDYLRTNPDIDPARIAVVGHSRLGKAAIVAAAFDDRIALVIPHQAGCGGTAPSRGKIGESVQRINTSFPHWFDAEFKTFNTQPERLPFDQNGLIALVAPRPVLLTNASGDLWANPAGQFEVLLRGRAHLSASRRGRPRCQRLPPPNTLVKSTLGYHIRPGKHSMGREDWKVFLEYADAHLKKSNGR